MTKSTVTYWNVLDPQAKKHWVPVKELEGMVEELTLSIDGKSGEYTKLTRFLPGADTKSFGSKTHCYPEEVFIVSGRLLTKHLTCGWSQDTMPVDLPENVMDHLKLILAVLYWKYRFQIEWVSSIPPTLSFH